MAHSAIENGPVEDGDRVILENNEEEIVQLMDPDRISQLLMDRGIIDNNDREQILLHPAAEERNKMLLDKLLTGGPEASKTYLNILSESNTKNHTKLYNILLNNDPTPLTLPVEAKLVASRHQRIAERIKNHEKRLAVLEEGVPDGKSETEVESLRAELNQTRKELEEAQKKLKTRDRELQDALEENKALQKRIQKMENKIVSLEAYIGSQMKSMQTQQQELKEQVEKIVLGQKQQQEELQDMKQQRGPAAEKATHKPSNITPRNRFEKQPPAQTGNNRAPRAVQKGAKPSDDKAKNP